MNRRDNISLTPYITVHKNTTLSFGGSQNWFSERKNGRSKRLHLYGCGLVAVGDFILHGIQKGYIGKDAFPSFQKLEILSSDEPLLHENYLNYLDDLSRHGFPIIKPFGSFSIEVALFLKVFLIRHHSPLVLHYLFLNTTRKRLDVIRETLQKDCPSILLLGPQLRKRKEKAGITFYTLKSTGEMIPAHKNIKHHFVNITGLYYPDEADRSIYLEISSWGQRFYIDYGELDTYIKKYSSPLFTSLFYFSVDHSEQNQ